MAIGYGSQVPRNFAIGVLNFTKLQKQNLENNEHNFALKNYSLHISQLAWSVEVRYKELHRQAFSFLEQYLLLT
jgi:hypothetical protein